MSDSSSPPRGTYFDEITVQRINLVEPDGTVRLILTNRDRTPGVLVKGTEYPHPNPAERNAGLLFYNEEGTENGGVQFGGKQGTSGGGLTFDQYEQDQVVELVGIDEPNQRTAGMQVWDRPDRSIAIDLQEWPSLSQLPPAELQALLAQRAEAGYYGASRLFAGKDPSGSSLVTLSDGRGRVRLRLSVTAGGDAAVEFLDAGGAVIQRIGPSS